LNGRRLGFVIREWAEEAPNRTLANMLAGSKDWDKEVESLRAHFEVWRERNPEADVDGWIDGTAWKNDKGDAIDPGAGRHLARRLQRRGLPDTPATVRYLRVVAAGVTSPLLPARGLLVTTFVFVRAYQLPTFDDPILLLDANPSVSITGPLELTTGPVFDDAKRVALGHQRWLRRWKHHPLSDMGAIRRAQPGAIQAAGPKGEEWFSYPAEALGISAAELRAKAKAHLNGVEGAITSHLDDVYRRVRKRRSDAGIPTKPPPNWRDEVRPFLTDLLRSTD